MPRSLKKTRPAPMTEAEVRAKFPTGAMVRDKAGTNLGIVRPADDEDGAAVMVHWAGTRSPRYAVAQDLVVVTQDQVRFFAVADGLMAWAPGAGRARRGFVWGVGVTASRTRRLSSGFTTARL